MAKGTGASTLTESETKLWSIPSKLILAVLPVSVVALLAGLFLAWSLISSDTSPGLSTTDMVGIVVAVVVSAVAVGSLLSVYRIGRSTSRRIRQVSSSARRVARKDLANLLDALRAPQPDLGGIAPLHLDGDTRDEVGELARSFQELHGSLIEVGARQMESLRAGVSSIFATLARRNSSLVDRQLALLDELESREEDPEVLGGYYRVDHLAARMRRNAESLLVLAGSESPRKWAKATDMSVVVRAAVSEVDEYQRIEVLALEPGRLSGGAVTDVAHLLAELLENAVQFSPPSKPVRVTGLFNVDGYQLSISDSGVGMSEARIGELNRILEKPPALGLSVEPTLGMHVVAKLAHRHGLDVELIPGLPGTTAKVTIPRHQLVAVRPSEQRPWDTAVAEGVSGSDGEEEPDAEQQTRADSREQALERTAGEGSPGDPERPVTQPVAANESVDEVIDLTHPAMTEPETSIREEPDETGAVGDLPVRAPGQTLRPEDPSESVAAGEAPRSIRSALAAYEAGRRAAFAADEHDHPETPDEDES